MKNLLIYVSPKKEFDEETRVTVKIQIDNSLDLGWKREDIMLFTNFDYEYNGVRAESVSDKNFTPFFPPATKITTIVELFKRDVFGDKEIYWFHDFDVFQNYTCTQEEMAAQLNGADIGLCDKGRMPRWATGSVFFKAGAKDIFAFLKKVLIKYRINEEPALNAITSNNLLWATEERPEDVVFDHFVPANFPRSEDMDRRIKKINIKYNFAGWNIRSCYQLAVSAAESSAYKLAGGPFKIVHFHPLDNDLSYGGMKALDFFMHGKNKMNTVLMPQRLKKIFNRHGIM